MYQRKPLGHNGLGLGPLVLLSGADAGVAELGGRQEHCKAVRHAPLSQPRDVPPAPAAPLGDRSRSTVGISRGAAAGSRRRDLTVRTVEAPRGASTHSHHSTRTEPRVDLRVRTRGDRDASASGTRRGESCVALQLWRARRQARSASQELGRGRVSVIVGGKSTAALATARLGAGPRAYPFGIASRYATGIRRDLTRWA